MKHTEIINEEVKTLSRLLFEKYESITLYPKDVAKVVGRSEISLYRDRLKSKGIPYTKLGARSGSDRVVYTIYDVAKFVAKRKIKVTS